MQAGDGAIQDEAMKTPRATLPAILIRIAVALVTSALLVGYCYVAFRGYPGQTYPFIMGAVAVIAWRLNGVTAGATLALTTLGIDLFVLDGQGLAIAKPEQAAGITVLICVASGLIWAIRHAGRERDAMRSRIARLDHAATTRQGMLDEMVHRVRNDLSAMSSLTALYRRRNADPAAGLKALSERIGVLGRLYQRLHISEHDPASVEMSVFLHEIVEDMRAAHLDLRPISLDAHIVSVTLPVQTASVVGLVLNEAVTNALKYAFPDDREGSIVATLKRSGDDEMTLEVCDDGVGPDGEAPKGTGMGTRLMKGMAAQIGGRHQFERTPDGLSIARLVFPIS